MGHHIFSFSIKTGLSEHCVTISQRSAANVFWCLGKALAKPYQSSYLVVIGYSVATFHVMRLWHLPRIPLYCIVSILIFFEFGWVWWMEKYHWKNRSNVLWSLWRSSRVANTIYPLWSGFCTRTSCTSQGFLIPLISAGAKQRGFIKGATITQYLNVQTRPGGY